LAQCLVVSATLVARGLAAGHGARVLFSDLDLVVAPGDVVGLVGVNGAGKSTLLRTLAGEIPAEEGSIVVSPPSATLGYLPQEHERRPEETVLAALARRTGVAAAQIALDRATEHLSEGRDGADDAYGDALERWLALGGADLEERAAQVVADVAPGVALDAPTTGLSGGQAARIGLASLLLSRYDVLLLDEPTNDLDLAGLEQLERFVAGARSGIVVVSHDREFLARTVTRVVELDLAQQLVRVHDGGYEAYLVEREVARRHAREEYEEYADTKAGLEARARMQRNWMAKGVRDAVKKQKDPDKFIKAHNRASAEKQAAKAKQTERLIERMEVVEEPRKEWELQMEIAAAPRAGAVVATLRGAVVERGGFRLGPVDLQVDWGDRVAITGANGSGKSTLLAALLGRVELTEGSSSLGPSVRIGEIDQARGRFLGSEQLLDAFSAEVPDWPTAEVRTLLAKFGLVADHVLRPAVTLSPGERTRAALALLQARGINVLVLDEPTNHLDLPAIEQLEQALASYAGTLLLVTHDRRMLEAVATNRHLEVVEGRVTER
jgi:ATPase subunit of ABC transporter with duplicated ATPase domains